LQDRIQLLTIDTFTSSCSNAIGNKRKDCKSEEDINAWLNEAQVSMFFNNFYFDSDDYNTPVKNYIDDKIWWAVMPKIRKDADMFIRQNKLSLQDDYIQITGDTQKEFISVSGQRESMDDYDTEDGKFIRVYFRVDPVITGYERQIYSSGDLLAQVGGIYSFLFGIGAVLVFIFSERLYVASIARKLYQIYDDKKDSKYNDPNAGDEAEPLDQSSANLRNKASNKIHSISFDVDEENRFFRSNPIRNLFKNTLYCKTKSTDIAKKLKKNKELDEIDMIKIKNLVTSRRRFNYNT